MQRSRESPGDLCDLERMREPCSEMLTTFRGEVYLGLVREPTEASTIQDPVTVAREVVAIRIRIYRTQALGGRGLGRKRMKRGAAIGWRSVVHVIRPIRVGTAYPTRLPRCRNRCGTSILSLIAVLPVKDLLEEPQAGILCHMQFAIVNLYVLPSVHLNHLPGDVPGRLAA